MSPDLDAAAPSRIAFLGFGLIGGSIAKSLRARGWTGAATAWTRAGRGPLTGAILDLATPASSPEAAIDGADLVVLAAPPLAVLELLGALATSWRDSLAPGALITDVASTKRAIVERATALRLPFVGGHPMAGRERTGVEAATDDLFVDRPWVVVAPAKARSEDVGRVRWLATSVAATPVEMGAEEHDAAVAAISHLPLVAAAALVEAVAGDRWGAGDDPARGLAASGWRDMTRLARGEPDMGAGILATNAAQIAARVRSFRDALDQWLTALDRETPDVDELTARLRDARARLGESRR